MRSFFCFILATILVSVHGNNVCSGDSCFDAMIAVNYLNATTLSEGSSTSDCFSLVVSDRSISGVQCSWMSYQVTTSSFNINHNFTSTEDFKPIIDQGCTEPINIFGPQFTSTCGLKTPASYALNMFYTKHNTID